MREIKVLNKTETYTEEQKEIIYHKYKKGDIIRVNAFAGVGKSFVLKEFSKKRPDKKMLYLAFNKSIQIEASKKFPKNVLVKTSHSLAYKKFGYQLQHKLSFSELKPLFISSYFELNSNFEAMLIWETVKKFMQSADFEINIDHIPLEFEIKIIEKKIDKLSIVDFAVKLWEQMINENNQDITATHDTYLKLYQLSKPLLNYDYILNDENQDNSLCVFDIVMRQKKAIKIFVGDENQSIYQFRGAVNAMNLIDPNYDFYLTRSFRFGENIADMANSFLNNLKNKKVNITGSQVLEENQNNIAFLARTNSGVFQRAIETPGNLFFVGGVNTYRFSSIFDVYNLWIGEKDKIYNPFVKMFDNFEEYVKYGEEVNDVEIASNVSLIKNYGRRLPGLLYDIKNRSVENEKEADLILSTAHKAKGCEWYKVEIAEDFFPIFDKESFENEINKDLLERVEEINLIYVTITRAKKEVDLNCELFRFMSLYNKKEI